jgi:hypothetical protein
MEAPDTSTIPPVIKEFLESPQMKGHPVSYEEFQHDGGVKSQLNYYPEGKRGYIASMTTDRKPGELDHLELVEHFVEVSKQLKASMSLTFV